MKKVLFLFLMVLACPLYAQTIDEVKESGQFLYGLSADKNEAVDQVFMSLVDYMEQEPECDSTNWESKLQNLQDGDKFLVFLIKKDLLSTTLLVEKKEPLPPLQGDEQIIRQLVDAGDYFRLKEYLQARQNNFHDILFESVRSGFPNNENCYWAIFDDKARIIVIVDKSGTKDILSGNPINLSDYQNNKKMWIQIY